MLKFILSLILISIIVTGINCNKRLHCTEIQDLVLEHFDESIVNQMICTSYFESNKFDTLTSNKVSQRNFLGLWNLEDKFCNTLCKSICNDVNDLMDPKVNAQCASLVYIEFGFNYWDTNKRNSCDDWDQCIVKSLVIQYSGYGPITGTGSITTEPATYSGCPRC